MLLKLLNVRISFCQTLFDPKQVLGQGEPKYSSSFLIQKSDKENIQKIKSCMEKVATEEWGNKGISTMNTLFQTNKTFLHDGNEKSDYEGYDGCFYISASRLKSKGAVKVFDMEKNELTEGDGIPYSGCYVDVSMEIYAQDNTWGKRINAVLKAVRFRSEGEPLGVSAPANVNEFDDISDIGNGTLNLNTINATTEDEDELPF